MKDKNFLFPLDFLALYLLRSPFKLQIPWTCAIRSHFAHTWRFLKHFLEVPCCLSASSQATGKYWLFFIGIGVGSATSMAAGELRGSSLLCSWKGWILMVVPFWTKDVSSAFPLTHGIIIQSIIINYYYNNNTVIQRKEKLGLNRCKREVWKRSWKRNINISVLKLRKCDMLCISVDKTVSFPLNLEVKCSNIALAMLLSHSQRSERRGV